MAFQGRHSDVGTFIGSWPVLPSVVASQPVLLPRTMQSQATILGIQREPPAGYDVDGRKFTLTVDSTPSTISFSYVTPLPLSEVISQINTCAGVTVAANDNGFLKLQSPTIGDGSYLKVETDPLSSPTDVLLALGLFPETEAYAGDLTQAQHVDPDRQVATPGQMVMSEGENFESRVFNRALASLALNNDRNEGQLSKKRVASRAAFDVASYATPGAVHGVQLSGGLLAYTGRATTPSVAALEKLFAVLDSEGNELSKVLYVPIITSVSGTFSTATDGSGKQICTSSAFNALAEGTYEAGAYYLVSSVFTGGATVLNDKPLKLLELRGGLGAGSEAVIENIDPATGDRAVITDAGIAFEICRRDITKVVVDGVFENVTTATAGTPRLENVEVAKRSSIVPTRIELGNRIVCAGEDFTASTAVQVGDLVTWVGSTIGAPFSNNGAYRVDRVIDPETLQVVASDWSAAILNPAVTGGAVGTLTISTDGDFVLDPFLRFPSSSSNAVPEVGEAIEIAYLKGATFREATDDNPAIFQSDVRFAQEADDVVTRAILRMWGPSVTSLSGVLYGDYRVNLEHINARLNEEHYTYDDTEKAGSGADDTRSWGRHKDIRPDTIDMWGYSVAEERVTLRSASDSSGSSLIGADSHELMTVRDINDVKKMAITSLGHLTNRDDYDDQHVMVDWLVDATDRYKLWGIDDTVSGYAEWIGQRTAFGFNTDPGPGMMCLQDLYFLNDVPGATVDGYNNVTLLRLMLDWPDTSESKGFWGSGITFLSIGGALESSAAPYTNYNYVSSLTGIDINYGLTGDVRVLGDHIGLKIADITNAGTGIGGEVNTGSNYAIYTNLGWVRLGDRLLSEVLSTQDSVTSGIGADFVIAETAATPTGGSVGFLLDYDMAHTGASSFTASAMWLKFQKSTAVNNTGEHSILRLTDGSFSNESGTHTGLYIDNVTGGTTDYAIYTNTGAVRFGGLVTGVEGFSAPIPSGAGVALNMYTSSAVFKIACTAAGYPQEQWDTGDTITYDTFLNSWTYSVGSYVPLVIDADCVRPGSATVNLGASSYRWGTVVGARCDFVAQTGTMDGIQWSFTNDYNNAGASGSSGTFSIREDITVAEASGIRTLNVLQKTEGPGGSTISRIGARVEVDYSPRSGTSYCASIRGLDLYLGSAPSVGNTVGNAHGIYCDVNLTGVVTAATGVYARASGGVTNYAIRTGSGMVKIEGNGLVVGSPTGGDKGAGTINAQEVYDDGTPLTCYVIEQANTGRIDYEKWDKLNLGKEHLCARNFQSWVLDLEQYTQFWKREGHLPSLPSPKTWLVERGALSLGKLSQRLWETVEVQAVHTAVLGERLSKLEKEVARLAN